MAETDYTLTITEINAAGISTTYNEELEVLDEEEPKIEAAYFAEKKVLKTLEADATHSYTFIAAKDTSANVKKSTVAATIRNEINATLLSQKKEVRKEEVESLLTETSYAKDAVLANIPTYNVVEIATYPKLTSAPMGYQVYLVLETLHLNGKKAKVKIQEKENEFKIVASNDEVLPVLVFANLEDTTTETEANDWIELDVEEENGRKYNGAVGIRPAESPNEDKIEVVIKKIQLRPKEPKITTEGEATKLSFKGWREALHIRENETVEGIVAIQSATTLATDREAASFITLTRDEEATKKSYAKKISGPTTIVVGKDATYTIDDYSDNSTEEDKTNIRWSFYVKGTPKPTNAAGKALTYIDVKSKAGLYTYAQMELVEGKNKLTIVFDEALKGKRVQIEAFRGSPDINNKKDWVKTTTVKEEPLPRISIRDTTILRVNTECDSVLNSGEVINKEFKGVLKLKTPELLYPFRTIPQNYPGNFKTDAYKKYDYTLHEKNAATFGYPRGTNRIHAARDLYTDVNEPVYAIADGIVVASHNFYMNTDVITIQHEYEHTTGYDIVVRYGEVDKNTIEVNVGDRVLRGQKIGEVGQLVRNNGTNFQQPSGENRGMLHIEFYTGKEGDKTFKPGNVPNSEMQEAVSDGYSTGRSFQRRRDLYDPLELLEKMIISSKKENLIE